MKRVVMGLTAAAVLAVPGVASADPVSKRDRAEAKKECRAFADAAGTKANLGRVFGAKRADAAKDCRATQARKAHREDHRSARDAAKRCRADHSPYENRGQCVAAERRKNNREEDSQDRDRVEQVRSCRGDEDTPVTGRAFGRCVANAMSNDNAQAGQEHADQGAANGEQGSTAAEDGQARRPAGTPPTA